MFPVEVSDRKMVIVLFPTGSNQFYDNIEDMIGYRPISLIKWCWKIVTPGICAVRTYLGVIPSLGWFGKLGSHWGSRLDEASQDPSTLLPVCWVVTDACLSSPGLSFCPGPRVVWMGHASLLAMQAAEPGFPRASL